MKKRGRKKTKGKEIIQFPTSKDVAASLIVDF